MAWEENSCICLHMQLIAILSRIGVCKWTILLLLFKLHCKINKDLRQLVAEVWEKFIIRWNFMEIACEGWQFLWWNQSVLYSSMTYLIFRIVYFQISHLISQPSVANSMGFLESVHTFSLHFIPNFFKGILFVSILLYHLHRLVSNNKPAGMNT